MLRTGAQKPELFISGGDGGGLSGKAVFNIKDSQ